jgi:hypothetical protein
MTYRRSSALIRDRSVFFQQRLKTSASGFVSMPVLNVSEIPTSEQSWNSVETILDAADTSVRATILQFLS